ncbi:hypothetical protein GCK32_017978 [Trichostrongylus colubriformis]|uniref:Uncharacterized protein n=1 Tax=Trichostrongylus colubriformis TaxID=6319 RepID=A0AAN8IRW1_TRICO
MIFKDATNPFSSRKKRKKKKESAEAVPQEQQEKHILYLPKSDDGERFPELQIVQNDVRLIDARLFSAAVANSTSIQWREFLRLQLPAEKVHRRVLWVFLTKVLQC